MRRALGIAPETFVFIAFGELRAYKNVDFLLQAFAGVNDRDVALIVAGPVKQPELAAAVENAAAGDGGIKPSSAMSRTTRSLSCSEQPTQQSSPVPTEVRPAP